MLGLDFGQDHDHAHQHGHARDYGHEHGLPNGYASAHVHHPHHGNGRVSFSNAQLLSCREATCIQERCLCLARYQHIRLSFLLKCTEIALL